MFYQTAQLEEMPIIALKDTLEFAKYKSLQSETGSYKGMMPGRFWFIQAVMHDKMGIFEDVYCYSDILARFVWNRSGGTLAQGALAKFYRLSVANITAGAVNSFTSAAAFVADEQVSNMAYVLDNADAAGAAPEGQMRFIVKNTANICYVQPNFSVALAVNDDIEIRSRTNVIASAAGDSNGEIAGAVLAPDGIPDNYGGWVCKEGICAALIRAAVAVTEDKGLIAHTGRLDEGSTSATELIIAHAIVGCTGDIASGLIPVEMVNTRLNVSE